MTTDHLENLWKRPTHLQDGLSEPIPPARWSLRLVIELIPQFHQRVCKTGPEHIGYDVASDLAAFYARQVQVLTGQQVQSEYCSPSTSASRTAIVIAPRVDEPFSRPDQLGRTRRGSPRPPSAARVQSCGQPPRPGCGCLAGGPQTSSARVMAMTLSKPRCVQGIGTRPPEFLKAPVAGAYSHAVPH